MRQLTPIVLAIACFTGFGEARAEDISQAVTGITYFNRPGATPEDHLAALDRCATAVEAMGDPNIFLFSGGATYNAQYSPAANAGGAMVLVLIDAARVSAATERAENTHYQNCMIAQGWRVIRLENNTGRRMARMRPTELAAQLAPMIGAAEPEGELGRQFNNDLASAGSLTPVPTRDGRFISLSRLSLPSDSEAAERRREARRMPSAYTREEAEAARAERRRQYEEEMAAQAPTIGQDGNAPVGVAADKGEASETVQSMETTVDEEKQAGGGLTAEEISALAEGTTLVAFRQRGVDGGVVFRRIDGAHQDNFVVGAMVAPPVVRGRSQEPAMLEDAVVVVAVPPGRWRMESLRVGSLSVSLCMGSPAFDIAEGEVVYVGDFNFGADPFAPNLALDPAQASLQATPHFANRLRAASYANGSTGVCGMANHLYAYEVPVAASTP